MGVQFPPPVPLLMWGHRSNGKTARLHRVDGGSIPLGSTNFKMEVILMFLMFGILDKLSPRSSGGQACRPPKPRPSLAKIPKRKS